MGVKQLAWVVERQQGPTPWYLGVICGRLAWFKQDFALKFYTRTDAERMLSVLSHEPFDAQAALNGTEHAVEGA